MKKPQLLFVVTLVFSLLIQVGCLGSEPTPSPPVTAIPQSEEIPITEPEAEPGTTSVNESLSSEESGSFSTPIIDESKRPLLSDALIRNCGRNRTSGGFGKVGLVEGDTAIDFTLKDIHGNIVSLSELLSEKPVVMIFGSFT